MENSSKAWATAYNMPEVASGAIKKEELEHGRSAGMQGFVYNLRRPLFQDRRVRQALAYAFDFSWSNQTLLDRKSVVSGKSVSVRVELGGRGIIKKKQK